MGQRRPSSSLTLAINFVRSREEPARKDPLCHPPTFHTPTSPPNKRGEKAESLFY